MAGCSCGVETTFAGQSRAYRRVLWVVIAINASMFVVEMVAALLAGSQALKADALDFLGDTLTYGISLLVIGMPLGVRATAALLKGLSLGLVGIWVFASTAYHVLVLDVPQAPIMGVIGFLALAANFTCFMILMRFRDGDANVRSVWLCTRNDVIGNIAVLGAAAGVFVTGTAWPDLAVAAALAALFCWSAAQIIQQALSERQQAQADRRLALGRVSPS